MAVSSTETIELSDASGNYAPAASTASNTTVSGSALVLLTVPGTLTPGSGYKVRISSTFAGVTAVEVPVTVNGPLGAVAFTNPALPASICQGATPPSFAAAATNNTSITYAVTPNPADAGVTINNAGDLTLPATYVGTIAVQATATGCGGPLSVTHNLTVSPSVTTPVFGVGLPTSRCQGAGNVTFGATASNSTSLTYSLQQVPATPTVTINSGTGEVHFPGAFNGTVTISAEAAGCGGPKTATFGITVNPAVSNLAFALGATSNRCEGGPDQTYTATADNATGPITYSLSPAAAGTINTSTGQVSYASNFSGVATITATAPGCQGNITANHTVTVDPALLSLSFNLGSTSTICRGSLPVTYAVSALNNLGLTFGIAVTPGPGATGTANINAGTGEVTYDAGFFGTVVVSASALGCNVTLNSNHTVTVRNNVTAPTFNAGATSTRCQGAATESYPVTVANETTKVYSMALAPAGGATGSASINPATGDVTYDAGFFGTATITVTVGGCDGPKTAQHIVTVNGTLATPAFTIGATSARCQGSGTLSYTANATNNQGISYDLQLSSPDAGTSINAGNGDVTFGANFAGTATITVTALGCGGPLTATHTVTVVGRPQFLPGPASVRCQSFESVTYTATSTNGIVNNYSITPVNPSLIINSTNGQVTYGPTITGSVVITATASGPGCPSISNTFPVSVTPTVSGATFSGGPTSTRCQSLAPSTETYVATGSNQSGVTYSLNPAALLAGVQINSGTGEVTYPETFSGSVTVTAAVTGCGGSISTATRTVTVTPTVGAPVFNATFPTTRCQGLVTIPFTTTASTSTATAYTFVSNPGSGVAVTGANGAGQITFGAGFAGSVTITAAASGCNGPVNSTHTINVTPTVGLPVFDSGLVSVRCQGAASVRYRATATNTTGITYDIATVPNDPNTTVNPNTGMVTFSSGFAGIATITASAAGCNGPAESIHTITVIATPSFTIGASFARCQGAGTELFVANALHASSITYSMTTNPNDPASSINAGSGLATFGPNFSGTAIVSAKGCAHGDSARLTVHVNATPHIYTLTDSTCSGNTPAAPLLSTIAGSTFTWNLITPMPSRLSSSGVTTGSGATINNPAITNSSDVIDDSARYNVTTTYTANGKTCSGTDIFTLKVRHRPTVTTASSLSICSGVNTNIILTASDTNSTFNWSSPANLAVTINGNPNNGTTCNLCNTISQILRDTGVNTGIVQYNANATANGCTGQNKLITVTVNPNPIITFPRPNTNFSVCSEKPLTIQLLDTPGVGSTSFYWTRVSQSGLNVFDAPFGNVIRDSVVNLSPSTTPPSITYTIFDTSFLGCAANPVQFTVTVNPKPVFNSVTKDICSQDSANVALTASTGAGSTFNWTVLSTTGGITGAGAGGGVIIGQPLRNPTFTTPGTVTYTVVPISPAPASCQGDPGTVVITVNPLPQMTSDTSRTICSDQFLNYEVESSTSGLNSYTYSRSATTPFVIPEFKDAPISTATVINDSLSSGYSLVRHRVEYLINLTSAAGCKFNNQRLGVTINPTPDSPGISIAPQPNLCRNTIGINLGARRQPDASERFAWSSNQSISQLSDSTRFALATFNAQGTASVFVKSSVVGFSCFSRESKRDFNVSAGSGSNNPNVVFFQNNLVCQGANIAKYQWGFDRRVNLDSVIIDGATYQNLFTGAGSGFDPGANYYWVMATFSDGCTRKAYFNGPSLAAPAVAKRSNADIKLYPNPAMDELNIEFSEAGSKAYTIEVYDVAGRRLHSQAADGVKSRVDVRSFVPGYYTVICVQEGSRLGSARFIKQ